MADQKYCASCGMPMKEAGGKAIFTVFTAAMNGDISNPTKRFWKD